MLMRRTVQVTSYVPAEMKAELDRIAATNRRKSVSCQIEEALEMYLQREKKNEPTHGAPLTPQPV